MSLNERWAEYGRALDKEAADWIEWNGGECPVAEEKGCWVKLEDDRTIYGEPGSAHGFRWSREGRLTDIVAYRLVDAPGASTGEWIDWRGGRCPVDGSTEVAVRYRDGATERCVASRWPWKHEGTDDDIVAYRVMPPPPTSALTTQVGGDHYKGATIQPVEFCVKNKMESLESAIVKRAFRHDKPTGKGREDVEKIIHEAQLLLELKYGVAA